MQTKRLTRAQWLHAGLDTLARVGPDGLKPEKLARQLQVSRGSFYWHFSDVSAFHNSVLDAWEAIAVDDAVAQAMRLRSGSTKKALWRLVRLSFAAPTAVERAIHQWAARNPLVAEKVAGINSRRLTILESLFAKNGGGSSTPTADARILYWAYLGRIALNDEQVDPKTIERLGQLLNLAD